MGRIRVPYAVPRRRMTTGRPRLAWTVRIAFSPPSLVTAYTCPGLQGCLSSMGSYARGPYTSQLEA